MRQQIDDLDKKFNEALDDTMEMVDLNNIELKDALKNQLTLEMVWQTLLSRGKALKEQAEFLTENAFSVGMETELKNSYRTTTVTEAREFAKCTQQYRESRKLMLDATALYDDIKSAVETVTSRRYILNNMTNAIIAGCERHVL